jgi:hypothetical protein
MVFQDLLSTCPSEQVAPVVVKRRSMKSRLICFCLATLPLAASAAEPPGRWIAPNAEGQPWKHEATGLTFPQLLDGYRLAGEFVYSAGGGRFIRYENLEQRARGDIFFFPLPAKNITMEEKQRLILQEMDNVVKDLQVMTEQGRYKNLVIGELGVGDIPLWEKDALPMAARVCEMTRVARTQEGMEQARLKQWAGIMILDDFLITIRQMRPISAQDDGAAGLQFFAQRITKIIKAPPLRAGVAKMIDRYMNDPLSEESVQATGAVLAYLKTAPDLPITIPEYPVQDWLAHCKKVAPGTEEQLLSAFMLGSAKVAIAGGDSKTTLNAGAAQFAKVFRMLHAKHTGLLMPQMDDFLAAADEGTGGDWLLRFTSSGK